MKRNIILLLSFLIYHINLFAEEYNKLPVINAATNRADWYDVQKKEYSGWKISPEITPDTWRVVCDSQATHILYTDMDSFSVTLSLGDTTDFYVKLGTKYALTRIIGQKKPVRMLNDSYIKEHKNAYFVNIPELYELFYIIASITPTGIENPVLFNNHTSYYKEVKEHFYPFRKDSIVNAVENAVKHLDLLMFSKTKQYYSRNGTLSMGYNY